MAKLASGQRITPKRSRGFQAGTSAWSTSASSQAGPTTVTFPEAFDATPSMSTQIVSAAGSAVRATVLIMSVTSTQFQYRVDLSAAATVSGSLHWQAHEI